MNQIKVELLESMGSDRSICEAAWTSSVNHINKSKKTDEDVKKLIHFLAEHKHGVPFESVVFRFWIKMPIFTDRQFIVHRLQSASGLSGRYRKVPTEYLEFPDDAMELIDKVKKRKVDLLDSYYSACETSNNLYSIIIEDLKEAEKQKEISNEEFKRLREVYRGMLPQCNMTERVSIMNLRSFANFIKLRTKENAQPEIREAANQMLAAVKKANVCPLAIQWLEKNNWEI